MSEEAVPMIVLIPTRARAGALEATLSSLANADRPAGFKFVMVVENGSVVGKTVVEKMVSRIPVRYLHTPDPGKSHALNLALEEVDEELIVFFDDDVAIGRETLLAYAAGAGKWGRGHFFGGVQRPRWVGEPELRYEDLFPRCMKEVVGAEEGPVADDSELFPFLGFNWAAWAPEVRRVGGFDLRFGPGSTTGATGQETEAQYRLTRGGCHPILLADCRVEHVVDSRQTRLRWLVKRRFRIGIEEGLTALDTPGRWPRRMFSEIYWVTRGFFAMLGHASNGDRWARWIHRSARFAGTAYAGVIQFRPGLRKTAGSARDAS